MARYGLLVVRLLLLVALVVSAMLVADALSPSPAFCGEGGGCAAVQASSYSAFAGVPLPFLGFGGFGFLFGLSLARAGAATRALRFSLFVAAGVALALIGLQAKVIGVYCPLCMTVDVTAVLAALVVLSPRSIGPEALDPLPAWSWVGLLLLAAASPIAWSVVRPPPEPPAALEALYAREHVKVVELADFTCPHCRALNPTLEAALRDRHPAVGLARIIVPVTGHPRGPAAARAYICADDAGHGEAMAHVLFGDGGLALPITEWASRVGMSAEALEACMTSEATTAKLLDNAHLFDALDVEGLPTLFIGDRVLLGEVDRRTIDDALDALERESSTFSVPPAAFGVVLLALMAALIGFGRRSARR
jgi:protein-disulfide isomerase